MSGASAKQLGSIIAGLVRNRGKVVVCEACGHPKPDNEIVALLTGKQRRLFEIIVRSGTLGIGVHDIMPELYANDPTGGPTNSQIISVMAHHINKKIAPFGLKLSCRRGPWAVWRLTETEETA
jgi:hypothetical protein